MNNKFKIFIFLTVVIFISGTAGFYVGQKSMIQEFKLGRRGYETFYAFVDEIRDKEIKVSGIAENSINYRGEFFLVLSENTRILNASDNTRMEIADLVVGNEIFIRFHGGIWESYPGTIPEVDVIYLIQNEPHVAQETPSIPVQETDSFFAYDSINQYITYHLPETVIDGGYNRELGYLGGNLFCLKENGSCIAQDASDGTPPGWNSFGGAEVYYKLNCQFDNGQLTNVFLPWNHAAYLTDLEPVDDCMVPAVLVQVNFELFTSPEADVEQIEKNKQNSTMWYVFFGKEDSDIGYAIFLNAANFSKEETISLAQSVRFSNDAFNLSIE